MKSYSKYTLMRRKGEVVNLLTKKPLILTTHSISIALIFIISNAVITEHTRFLWVQIGKLKYLFKSLCVES